MSRLIYSMICSLDGFVTDPDGRFDWAMPDEEVHMFISDLEAAADTYVYGRRMYETMRVWDSPEMTSGQPPYIEAYARTWQAADKIVYSSTLEDVDTMRTRLERVFDPVAIRDLKRRSARDILIGGPTLAASAIRAGLVDEYQLFVAPVLVGGGLPVFPSDIRVDLQLENSRRFGSGMLFLRYSSR